MSSSTIECRACRYPVAPGAALLVTPLTGSPPAPPFAIHRPSVVSGCIQRAAARASDAAIALLDPVAARVFDRASADGGSRTNGPTFEAQARARNAAISAGRPRYELSEE